MRDIIYSSSLAVIFMLGSGGPVDETISINCVIQSVESVSAMRVTPRVISVEGKGAAVPVHISFSRPEFGASCAEPPRLLHVNGVELDFKAVRSIGASGASPIRLRVSRKGFVSAMEGAVGEVPVECRVLSSRGRWIRGADVVRIRQMNSARKCAE
jgi:hypothetical protein